MTKRISFIIIFVLYAFIFCTFEIHQNSIINKNYKIEINPKYYKRYLETKCDKGFYLNGDKCFECYENCLDCNGIKCTECEIGYFPNEMNCFKCYINCLECDGKKCTKCIKGY